MELVRPFKSEMLPPMSFPPQFCAPLSQKEWMRVIHKCLVYLSENNPDPETNLYKEDRQVLPSSFFVSRTPSQYCYAFKGIFLPSGNLDGRVWKPSQGARPTGDGLMKRYFYFKENNVKVKRQVIWLTANENWCFLDYRCNMKGKIKIGEVLTPDSFDFGRLLSLVDSLVGVPLEVVERKRKVEKEPQALVPFAAPPAASAGSMLSNLLDDDNNGYFYAMPDIFNEQDELEDFVRSLEEETCTLPPLLGYLKEEDEIEVASKKRKVESDFSNTLPLAVPQNPFSFAFSSFDYFFNHLLSYEQILDTICQSICTQLIFNRTCFYKTGLDPNTLLQTMKQNCSILSVDFKEFPGRLMSNFFTWLFEIMFKASPTKLPTVYCYICGCPDSGVHDAKGHTEFYDALDQPLLDKWKQKAHNFYDLVKELISYLLRYPNSRQSFCSVVEQSLHCPFCSRKNGTHCHETHDEWRAVFGIDTAPESAKEPEKAANLDICSYTKSSFEFLMDQMPFQIPSFLLSLNNVQSFLDCLVAIWRSLRLIL